VEELPLSCTAAPKQIVWSGPALTSGRGFTVKFVEADVGPHSLPDTTRVMVVEPTVLKFTVPGFRLVDVLGVPFKKVHAYERGLSLRLQTFAVGEIGLGPHGFVMVFKVTTGGALTLTVSNTSTVSHLL
jgi:hypothetical protein